MIWNSNNEEDFLKLDSEIIFVFSHTVKKLDINVHDKKSGKDFTIEDILKKYELYDGLQSGSNTGKIMVLKTKNSMRKK